jgi:hypothetical protein
LAVRASTWLWRISSLLRSRRLVKLTPSPRYSYFHIHWKPVTLTVICDSRVSYMLISLLVAGNAISTSSTIGITVQMIPAWCCGEVLVRHRALGMAELEHGYEHGAEHQMPIATQIHSDSMCAS